MKRKHYWVQFVPILGVLLVLLLMGSSSYWGRYDEGSNQAYMGGLRSYYLSAILQAAAFSAVVCYLLLRV